MPIDELGDMRVWHVLQSSGGGAYEDLTRHTGRLAAAMAAAGGDVRWFVGRDLPRSLLPREARPLVERWGTTRELVREWRESFLDGERPDIVHFHEAESPPHPWPAWWLTARGAPYVVSPHGELAPARLDGERRRPTRFPNTAAGFRLGRARTLVVADHRAATDLRVRLGVHAPPVAVVANALEDDVFAVRRGPRSRRARPLVLALCGTDPRAGGLATVAALAALLPGVDMVIPQGGAAGVLRSGSRLPGWAPRNVAVHSPVADLDRWEALAGADLVIQPTGDELAAVAEAMAVGVPCAVSEALAARLPVRDGELGLVLDPTPATAAAAIRAALDDPEQLGRWGRRAAAHAARRFRPSAAAAAHLDLYMAAVNGEQRPLTVLRPVP